MSLDSILTLPCPIGVRWGSNPEILPIIQSALYPGNVKVQTAQFLSSINRVESSTTPIFLALLVTEIDVSHTSLVVILGYTLLWGEKFFLSLVGVGR